MDRIAEILGLTGAALAHRFGNKRQLFVAFARRQPSGVEDLITQQRQSHSDPLEAVIEFYVALVSTMTTRNEVANNLVMLNLDLTDNELGEQARLHAQTIKRCTADLLDEAGIDNATDAAHHLYTIWNGEVLSWAIYGAGTLDNWLRHHLTRALTANTTSRSPISTDQN